MPWFMIKLDGWRKWLLGFFRERISAMLSRFPFLFRSCVQLMDAVELALRFINYDVLCIASHYIALKCIAVGLPLCILSYCGSDLFFSLAVSIHVIFFFSCCFSSDFTTLKSPCALQCTLHSRCIWDVYFCIMSINVFFFSLFKGIFTSTQMGFS